MTTVIFIEYLHWFDRQMEGKKVLLLVDGHSSHVAAVKQLKDQHGDHLGLRNTTIAFLPVNTTSIYQPMDQGIINNLKIHYRKVWLQHMVNLTLDNKDAIKGTTILNAVHWILEAWRKVPMGVIDSCWKKSTLLGPVHTCARKPSDWEEREVIHMKELAEELARAGRIKEIMDINNFINPPDEQAVDTSEDLLQQVAETFTEVPQQDDESTIEQQEAQPISRQQALDAINLVIQYEEQQAGVDLKHLAMLRHRQKSLFWERFKERTSKKQATLDTYFQLNTLKKE